ncbi:MAG: group II intron reverse transcriptase/maturase [Mycobacterium sp.]|nr:group II intron reverse transcriptase/maturase [Mycobacterium sp.]
MSIPVAVSTKRQQIAELVERFRDKPLLSLYSHLDEAWLDEALRRVRKNTAPGVDGQRVEEYAATWESRRPVLLDLLRGGEYRPPPVRRTFIPKADGRERPIGIPTVEDRVAQRAIAMLLEPLYEREFLDCSYGYRPKRSAHDAVKATRNALMERGAGLALEVDIRGFFDAVRHDRLREILDERLKDGAVRRIIHRWLKAGVLYDGCLSRPEDGTPQGGVISPLLANIYLHAVLDRWFENEVKPTLLGRAKLIRFADDFVIVFTDVTDAEGMRTRLEGRFADYGLELHPEKTRLVDLREPASRPDDDRDDSPGGAGLPRTFDYLGFTFYRGRTRRGNRTVIKVKTAASRLSRFLSKIAEWCRKCRHDPLDEQRDALARRLRGHFQYYGVTFNTPALWQVLHQTERLWFTWLSRRSQRARLLWQWFSSALTTRLRLPRPHACHPLF